MRRGFQVFTVSSCSMPVWNDSVSLWPCFGKPGGSSRNEKEQHTCECGSGTTREKIKVGDLWDVVSIRNNFPCINKKKQEI